MSNQTGTGKASFAPSLTLRVLAPALQFYKDAFGVVELKRYSNDDGSIHVAELMLEGTEFYLHEEMPGSQGRSPESVKGTTVELVIFVPDPDALMARALAAGGKEAHPMQDYFYGLRQGTVEDPFGHLWTFQKRIAVRPE
ncbi:VOC family protein [Flavitalea sp. BT771]|uniref:VOC family protein n=1 Tax=Flavitalea sp. BT771 TaxID=3063329 RepID=UPI0026E330EE|nr:VOC family protein [Flavitalea sp. BT771]MDO6432182.1 VOC family protein [Flavitalea sp. BT771]MDV6221092.1 VOC family protein [Flavitalea sp. BT771]